MNAGRFIHANLVPGFVTGSRAIPLMRHDWIVVPGRLEVFARSSHDTESSAKASVTDTKQVGVRLTQEQDDEESETVGRVHREQPAIMATLAILQLVHDQVVHGLQPFPSAIGRSTPFS